MAEFPCEEIQDNNRSISPVFHLAPPSLLEEEQCGSIVDNGLLENPDGIPIITKVEAEPSQSDKNGENLIVFCKCCGCFGLTHEFYEQVYCTRACSDSYYLHMNRGPDGKLKKPAPPVLNKKPKLSVPEKVPKITSSNGDFDWQKFVTESRVKPKLPVYGRPGPNGDFDWTKYLADTKAKAAPHRLFRQPAMPPPNPFKVGMMLESIDPQHQSIICVAVVVEIQGYRVRLRFQGFSEAYDYWVNADSLDIFPPGWCEENNLDLEPPPGSPNPFNWHAYIVEHQVEVAPRHIFAVTKEDFSIEPGVKVGMKLEAVDIRNQNLVCVATVAKVMGDRLLVHFDSWDPLYDYWTDLTSPFIHPVGWCEKNNVKLTPPNYCKPDFAWEKYLRETNTQAMPARLFRPLPPVGFRKGFKIECVDKRNPLLIRVATIAEVEEHHLLIHFDNWPEMYDYKVYELSPDIHPVGWCTHTGHPLQPPPPADGTWSGACTVFGCLALGHMRGPKFVTHNSEKYCPYALHNYKKDWILADRLILLARNMGLGHSHCGDTSSSNLESSQKGRGENKDTCKGDKEDIGQHGSMKNGTTTTKKASPIKRKRSSANSSGVKRRKSTVKQINNPKSIKVVPDDDKNNVQLLPTTNETNGNELLPLGIVQENGIKMKSDTPISSETIKLEGDEVEQKETPAIDEVKSQIPHDDNKEQPTEPPEIKTEPLLEKSSSSSSSLSSPTSSVQKQLETTTKGEESVNTFQQPVTGISRSNSITSAKSLSPIPSTTDAGVDEDEAIEASRRRISLPSTSSSTFPSSSNNSETESEVSHNYTANSQSLKSIVGNIDEKTVAQWQVQQLADFIATIPGCQVISKTFTEHLIDGESFLMLSQNDFIKVMGLKLGPAIKLSNIIRMINFNNATYKAS